jgi:UDP-N-acetylmuramate dehydrogenase
MGIEILQDYPLDTLNTFGLPACGRYFCRTETVDGLRQALNFAETHSAPVLILGGGSNVVLTQDFAGLVVHIALKGIKRVEDTPDHSLLRVEAGEDWHALVEHCLERNYFGLENLSLIPGTVGAAPIQNIGAYGVELRERLESLQALDRATGELVPFDNEQCGFSYRASVFKGKHRDRYIITSVTLKLDKLPAPVTTYRSLGLELEAMGVTSATPDSVSQAVCNLRRRKLPDPAALANAGSFFKNPLVPADVFEQLKSRDKDLVGYPQADGQVRLAAGWMIDRTGWKGVRRGAAGVHTEHALVLVNHGGATAAEILGLAGEIQHSVKQTFGVELEIEPRLY